MIFNAKFRGVRVGNPGLVIPQETYCYGEDERSAHFELLRRYEEISDLKMNLCKVVIILNLNVGDVFYIVENGRLITDPVNSVYRVEDGTAFAGFRSCTNMTTGIVQQLNDGIQCIVRPA